MSPLCPFYSIFFLLRGLCATQAAFQSGQRGASLWAYRCWLGEGEPRAPRRSGPRTPLGSGTYLGSGGVLLRPNRLAPLQFVSHVMLVARGQEFPTWSPTAPPLPSPSFHADWIMLYAPLPLRSGGGGKRSWGGASPFWSCPSRRRQRVAPRAQTQGPPGKHGQNAAGGLAGKGVEGEDTCLISGAAGQ